MENATLPKVDILEVHNLIVIYEDDIHDNKDDITEVILDEPLRDVLEGHNDVGVEYYYSTSESDKEDETLIDF